MKKTISQLIMAIETKANNSNRSSRSINNYINKIPCSLEQYNKPSEAALFVHQEMMEYPLPPKAQPSKRQQLLGEKIKKGLNKNKKVFNQLIGKLQEKLNFLYLQQMREIIQLFTEKQINDNVIGLKKLKNAVNYFLQSSSQNIHIEEHILEAAKELIAQIRVAQKKRVNLIV